MGESKRLSESMLKAFLQTIAVEYPWTADVLAGHVAAVEAELRDARLSIEHIGSNRNSLANEVERQRKARHEAQDERDAALSRVAALEAERDLLRGALSGCAPQVLTAMDAAAAAPPSPAPAPARDVGEPRGTPGCEHEARAEASTLEEEAAKPCDIPGGCGGRMMGRCIPCKCRSMVNGRCCVDDGPCATPAECRAAELCRKATP